MKQVINQRTIKLNSQSIMNLEMYRYKQQMTVLIKIP
jgi:hypothetical protein